MAAQDTHILVADDDRDIRDLVTFKLTSAGFTVRSVGDGWAALTAIENEPPDLAVLDVMMPGLSGIDVLRRARANRRTRSLPVILLTARSRDVDVQVGLSVGANDYIIKPVSLRELLQRVTHVLAQSRS